MMKNLTPRSIAALAVVAVSFFLMVCIAQFGAGEFANVRHAADEAPPKIALMSAWLVQTIGAGVWALILLPLAWGVVCYFQEKTPDLLLRLAGTVVLAASISTIVGLRQGGLWAGHLGNAIAGALGGLSASLGAFGTVLAWLLALALFGVSLAFASDWAFHDLRRAGRAGTETTPVLAVEPPAAELLLDPAQAEPRAFVQETPRAAVAAAEMAGIVRATPDAAEAPAGWSASEEEDGRTVIAAPTGYRGVEFLPASDELAIPEERPRAARARPAAVAETQSAEIEMHPAAAAAPEPWFEDDQFHDDQLVTTSDAAFFLEETGDDTAEWETQDIGDITRADAEAPALEEAVEEVVEEAVEEAEVEEAVQVLFEAVTAPPAAAPVAAEPASGIGLPADSPYFDDVFAVDAGWPYATESSAAANDGGTDGGSAAADMATVLSAAPAQPAAAPPAVAAAEAPSVPEPEEEIVAFDDDVIVSRLPAEAFDELLAPAEEPSEEAAPGASSEPVSEPLSAGIAFAPGIAAEVAPAAEPVSEPVAAAAPVYEPVYVAPPLSMERTPQLPLFAQAAPAAESSSGAAVATLPVLDLARLHTMELDPLFHDAVNAILERGRASAVVLQRQLGIGYARGIRILDQMTTAGLVGPDTPTGSREIRLTRDAWQAHTSS